MKVVLLGYQKPDKFQNRYEEIASWPRLDKLLLNVDAPRLGANREEIERVSDVLKIAKSIKSKQSQIEVHAQAKNLGVNHLIYQIFKRNIAEPGLILIEDDVSFNHQALDFLANNLSSEGSLAAVAYVKRNHKTWPAASPRIALFPIQWGVAFANPVMQKYIEVYENRKIQRRFIQKIFYNFFRNDLDSFKIEKLTQWWFNHFFFCLRHGNWADAILQYSVYSCGGYYIAPSSSLVKDDNPVLDFRSITPRISNDENLNCSSMLRTNPAGESLCVSCDLENSHIEEASFSNLLGATKYRWVLEFRRIWHEIDKKRA